jgi:hypothetical protein
MADLTTEEITRHTLVIDSAELRALREAAKLALDAKPNSPEAPIWRAYIKLGQPNTRRSLTEEFANPALVGR